MWNDCRHHVRSCHQCQIRSIRKVEVPLMVSTPATLFTKIHVDIMYMPKARSLRYIAAATDDLSGAGEGRALRVATADSMAKFLWEEIFCRYERRHFIIQEAIVKACEGQLNRWPEHVHHAFFADRVTIRRATGVSPFYLLHGVHPVLPLDLTEATLLVDKFTGHMSTADLLAARMQQLEKRPQDIEAAAKVLRQNRFKSKEDFEQRYRTRLTKGSYTPGTLVLVRNKAIETSHSRKHLPRYCGPYQVVRQTLQGSYVISELDRSVAQHGIAANRLIPYISRTNSQLPQLAQQSRLQGTLPTFFSPDEENEDSENSSTEDS
ncbi:hypothetical protein PHLGIDRAFT_80719 [Phlebiopsis gigantea 11061_1 CR5-6]|uniref:Integrase zinc-binding domain-containing protein n=1 Tax=Phlebiopsis gigantea (strain 11061_1 CR5-6) TaxID=745531 RepID=A0A0C3RPE2_PHLG1|nr:hypothetical protein PHLGIDRAFT_80719 [Phlebiopsis gigantea 11061_1 CR5-6]